jgi:hypothetical protein
MGGEILEPLRYGVKPDASDLAPGSEKRTFLLRRGVVGDEGRAGEEASCLMNAGALSLRRLRIVTVSGRGIGLVRGGDASP